MLKLEPGSVPINIISLFHRIHYYRFTFSYSINIFFFFFVKNTSVDHFFLTRTRYVFFNNPYNTVSRCLCDQLNNYYCYYNVCIICALHVYAHFFLGTRPLAFFSPFVNAFQQHTHASLPIKSYIFTH